MNRHTLLVRHAILVLSFGLAAFSFGKYVDLSGDGWTCEALGVEKAVTVPSVVERYFTDLSGYEAPEKDGSRHESWIVREWLKLHGRSTWRRKFEIPESGMRPGSRITVRFEATRYFADVYVNGRFVHHDEAPDMPYEVDITPFAKKGANELVVKIGNPPGGDYDWRDYMPATAPDGSEIPGGRAMSGITGRVWLGIHDAVRITDVYVQNTPEVTAVNVIVSVTNASDRTAARNFVLAIAPDGADPECLDPKELDFAPGLTVVTRKVADANAKLWDLDHPNLYRATAILDSDGEIVDTFERTFGYRWIASEGIGTNAVLRLNGRRIVIRTAIGWGWYLGTGTVPSREDARREVAAAKALGLNAISFHRHNGQEIVLEEADRQGLLVYAEPGAVQGGLRSEHGMKINTERVGRWVKSFRSHPSLFHWNLINELVFGPKSWTGCPPLSDGIRSHLEGLLGLVHALDPSRNVTLTSAWGDVNSLQQMHMRANDGGLYMSGWRDQHHAEGPLLAWTADEYVSPTNYYHYSTDRGNILYWGEENAFSAPPRLALIVQELDRRGWDGTDGAVFRRWAKKVDGFLDRKGLREVYPTLDSFCVDLGGQALLQQGRRIELMRMGDTADGYAVNGWEAMAVENNSGIVDVMRNPKGDPGILASYNAPLRLAVHSRPVARVGDEITVDVHIINEKGLKGPHRLVVEYGTQRVVRDVRVTGGDVYGELLAEGLRFRVGTGGRNAVCASLDGVEDARGRFFVTAYDTSVPKLPDGWRIVVEEKKNELAPWLESHGIPFSKYDPASKERADVILVTRRPRDREGDAAILANAAADGTRVAIVKHAEEWADLVSEATGIRSRGFFRLGVSWLGGQPFARPDPLLDGFPSRGAVDESYEPLASSPDRLALLVEGEELVMGAWQSENCKMGTMVGRVRCGKGEIILSTLDLAPNLGKPGPDRFMINLVKPHR